MTIDFGGPNTASKNCSQEEMLRDDTWSVLSLWWELDVNYVIYNIKQRDWAHPVCFVVNISLNK